MNLNRPLYISKEDYAQLVTRVYNAWAERDNYSGGHHVEDISMHMEIAVQSITDVLQALDDMGFRYANNGNG